ncbi:MAG: STAS domain-containing protein, partial [Solirubrobacterales bacterium]|nr:STAS domain-containing protein [Solirubrobacterales bacterium]
TAAVKAAGASTRLASVYAALALAALIPAAGLLADVPTAALAGVLLYVAGRIFNLGDLTAIVRFDRFEAGLTLVTLATVAVIGVEQGIGVAVGLAILDRTRLSSRPHLHVLGRIPGTTSWIPLHSGQPAGEIPGVLVVLFATPLWYANATHFREQVSQTIASATSPPRLLVLDAIGMSDVDYTGARAFSEMLAELQRRGISFAIARAGANLRRGLERAGLRAQIGAGHFFPAVDEAVEAFASSFWPSR